MQELKTTADQDQGMAHVEVEEELEPYERPLWPGVERMKPAEIDAVKELVQEGLRHAAQRRGDHNVPQAAPRPWQEVVDSRALKSGVAAAFLVGTLEGQPGLGIAIFMVSVASSISWNAVHENVVSWADATGAMHVAIKTGWIKRKTEPAPLKSYGLSRKVEKNPLIQEPDKITQLGRDEILQRLKALITDMEHSAAQVRAIGSMHAASRYESIMDAVHEAQATFPESPKHLMAHCESLWEKEGMDDVLDTLRILVRMKAIVDSMLDALKAKREELQTLHEEINRSYEDLWEAQRISLETGSKAGLHDKNKATALAEQRWAQARAELIEPMRTVSHIVRGVLPSPERANKLLGCTMEHVAYANRVFRDQMNVKIKAT